MAIALFASRAFAFDADEWFAKRELLEREAERLRAAYSNVAARVDHPAENVAIPIETYEDGSIKTTVEARRAQYFHAEGFIWAENVVIVKNGRDGKPSARIDARNCLVDRATKSGWSEGAARVWHRDTTFTGTGVYFSSPESYVSVKSDSDVVSTDLKFGGEVAQ